MMFFFKQKTAYEMRISDWSSDVCSSYLKHRLGFPAAYGADARAVSAATGAFVNDDPVCLQATGFVLSPEGRIVTAVYSTRAIGRLLPPDEIGRAPCMERGWQ